MTHQNSENPIETVEKTDTKNQQENASATAEDQPSLKNVVASILAAGFGVQSSRNRERDFKQGNFKVFLIGGVVFTILFIVTIATIVNLVLG